MLDGDGVAGNYNLAGGDQPALRGDDAAWWLMNDVGSVQAASLPLGVEVRVEAYSSNAVPLAETTFYRYTITNRTAAVIDSVYAALFVDADLGSAVDDLVGSDTLAGMAYTYNADNVDGLFGNATDYGLAPPAVGVQVLRGPVGLPNGRDDDLDGTVDEPGERVGATAAPPISASTFSGTSTPRTPRELMRRFQGLWNDGSPVREWGNGYGQTRGRVTRFAFSGDPVTGTGWIDGADLLPPADQRMVVSTGPFQLAPGTSETITFAIPYARGSSNLDSIRRLRVLARDLRTLFPDEEAMVVPVSNSSTAPISQEIGLSRPFPNPTPGRAVVTYEMPAGTVLRATLHDVLGRELAVLHDGPTVAAAGELVVDGSRLSPGVYRVRVVVPAGEQTLQLVVAR